jgi:hypothetical protein
VVEDADRRHLLFVVTAEVQPVPRVHGAREHTDVGDPLAAGTALDLEDHAGDGTVGVTVGRRQQLHEPRHQGIHTRARDRRPEEDGMDRPSNRPNQAKSVAVREPRSRLALLRHATHPLE